MTHCRGRTRPCSLRAPAWSLAIGLLGTSPLTAQVCLGSTEESSGWIAAEYGRAAERANVMGVDAGWQLSQTLALFADGRITAYPRPDPRRDRLALGAAYTLKRSPRFGVCLTPGIERERIDDLRVIRVPVGVSLGWATTFDSGRRRLGFRVEPFFVYSRDKVARFTHTSHRVSARAAVVVGFRRFLLGLEHEEAFDNDARRHTFARIGFIFN